MAGVLVHIVVDGWGMVVHGSAWDRLVKSIWKRCWEMVHKVRGEWYGMG